jgi:hypothetical protein
MAADSKIKIANECQGGGLFWALRRGGGSGGGGMLPQLVGDSKLTVLVSG